MKLSPFIVVIILFFSFIFGFLCSKSFNQKNSDIYVEHNFFNWYFSQKNVAVDIPLKKMIGLGTWEKVCFVPASARALKDFKNGSAKYNVIYSNIDKFLLDRFVDQGFDALKFLAFFGKNNEVMIFTFDSKVHDISGVEGGDKCGQFNKARVVFGRNQGVVTYRILFE